MIYCFDLDETLCSTYYPEEGKIDCIPYKSRIDVVNKLYDEGHTILIDTARGSVTGIDHTEVTKEQLKRWGVKYHKLRVGVKLFADMYIDDRGINDKLFFL